MLIEPLIVLIDPDSVALDLTQSSLAHINDSDIESFLSLLCSWELVTLVPFPLKEYEIFVRNVQ